MKLWLPFVGLGVPNIGIHHPLFVSIKDELQKIFDIDEDKPVYVGHYTQKVPTNLVYLAKQHPDDPANPTPDLPDFSEDTDIAPYLVP